MEDCKLGFSGDKIWGFFFFFFFLILHLSCSFEWIRIEGCMDMSRGLEKVMTWMEGDVESESDWST